MWVGGWCWICIKHLYCSEGKRFNCDACRVPMATPSFIIYLHIFLKEWVESANNDGIPKHFMRCDDRPKTFHRMWGWVTLSVRRVLLLLLVEVEVMYSSSSSSSAALSWTVVVPWPRGEGCQVTKGSQLPPASRVRRVTKDIRHGVGDGDLGNIWWFSHFNTFDKKMKYWWARKRYIFTTGLAICFQAWLWRSKGQTIILICFEN